MSATILARIGALLARWRLWRATNFAVVAAREECTPDHCTVRGYHIPCQLDIRSRGAGQTISQRKRLRGAR